MSRLPAGVVEEFRRGRYAKEVATLLKAPEGQLQAARAVAAREHRAMDGVGRLRMVVTADAYHYWGRRLGYGCWQDKAFLREFERDNASVRVKCGGTRVQSGYRGYVASEALKAKYPAQGIVAAGKYAVIG